MLPDVAGLSVPKLAIPTEGGVPSGTFLNGEPKVMLGEGECREWRDPGNGGGFPRWYPPWLLPPYLAIISEEELIRPMGGFPYDTGAEGIASCC